MQHRVNLKMWALAIAAGVVGLGQVVMAAAPGVASERVNSTFGLKDSTVTTLQVDGVVGETVVVEVPIEGEVYTLQMDPFAVRGADYQVLVQVADGSLMPIEPGPVTTVRGQLVEAPESLAAGGWIPEGLVAKIVLDDESIYWIEPVARLLPDAPADLFVVYSQEDIIPSGAACATDDGGLGFGTPDVAERGGACGGTVCIAELGVDADVEYFNRYGTVANTEARINLVVNTVNVQYERDVDISHIIGNLIIRTAEPDPYTSLDYNVLLNQFRNWWLANQPLEDIHHLFTGKNLNGNVIGVAFTIGGVCTSSGFCLAESDCCGTFGCATDLTAHELGHLWGASHCNCTNDTMNPFITCVNQFVNAASVNSIVNHRNSRTCLTGDMPVIPCADVRRLRAQCTNGRLKVAVIMTNSNHSGQMVTVTVDGTPHVLTISGDRALLTIPNQGGTGNHTVALVDPPGCVSPVMTNCP